MNAGDPCCPRCGTTGALAGLCPRCLARAVLAPAPAGPSPGDGMPGEQIGGWELIEVTSEDPSAILWRARQLSAAGPEVALKILKPGADTARAGQTPAGPAHPPPAALLDRGTTQWGRPFLVLELVAVESRTARWARPALACAGAVGLALLAAVGVVSWGKGRPAVIAEPRARTPRQQYAADIRAAQQAWLAGESARGRQLLDGQRPAAGAEDFRGWEWRWLWQQLRAPAASGQVARAAGGQMLGPQVFFALLLPGGRAAYVVGSDARRAVVDLATLRETPVPLTAATTGLFAPPNFVGFPDRENRLALYEISAQGAALIAAVPLGADPPLAIAYAPATRTLAWSAGGAAVQVVPVDRPEERLELASGGEPVAPLAFDPTGRWLLGIREEGDARVWDLATRQRVPAAEACFSPDGLPVLVGGSNALGGSGLAAWISASVQRTALPSSAEMAADLRPRESLTARAFSPDGRTFALAWRTGGLALFDSVAGRKIATFPSRGRGSKALAFSPDGTRLLSSGEALWDVVTREELLRLPAAGSARALAQFSDDGGTLLVGSMSEPGTFQFWRAPTWEEIADAERRRGRWPDER